MKKYTLTGHGRKVGAIGVCDRFTVTLEAGSEQEARLDVYHHFESITNLRVREEPAPEPAALASEPRPSDPDRGGWAAGMAQAYTAGLEDGKAGTAGHREAPGGFEACYWQGVGHGSGTCSCPERLRARWPDQRCPCCGCRRAST